jgi:hypothetical protein
MNVAFGSIMSAAILYARIERRQGLVAELHDRVEGVFSSIVDDGSIRDVKQLALVDGYVKHPPLVFRDIEPRASVLVIPEVDHHLRIPFAVNLKDVLKDLLCMCNIRSKRDYYDYRRYAYE